MNADYYLTFWDEDAHPNNPIAEEDHATMLPVVSNTIDVEGESYRVVAVVKDSDRNDHWLIDVEKIQD